MLFLVFFFFSKYPILIIVADERQL